MRDTRCCWRRPPCRAERSAAERARLWQGPAGAQPGRAPAAVPRRPSRGATPEALQAIGDQRAIGPLLGFVAHCPWPKRVAGALDAIDRDWAGSAAAKPAVPELAEAVRQGAGGLAALLGRIDCPCQKLISGELRRLFARTDGAARQPPAAQ